MVNMIAGSMKSLFKSGVRDIKNRFSKRGEDDELPTPLGLRIGAAVDIDTLPLRMHADDLHVELPEETILIVAQGYVNLGDDSYVNRYYGENDTMIQILTVNGIKDQHVEEITLYVPYKSIYPSSEGELAQWTAKGGKIGAPTYRFDDGTEYERIWFDTTPGHVDPVVFTEEVYENAETEEADDVVQQVMLFGRNLEEGKKNEYLLITVEAYEGEKTVELMVGVDLDLSTVKVI
jgi:hypothetical protein